MKSNITLPINGVEFPIRDPEIKVSRGSTIVMEEKQTLIVDVSLCESHQRMGDIVGQDQLSKRGWFHDVINNMVRLSVGVLSKQGLPGYGFGLALHNSHPGIFGQKAERPVINRAYGHIPKAIVE